MSHTRITINDETILDTNLEQWEHTPPEALQQLIKPGPKQPWMMALMAPLIDALTQNQPVTITITTNNNACNNKGWTMNVNHERLSL